MLLLPLRLASAHVAGVSRAVIHTSATGLVEVELALARSDAWTLLPRLDADGDGRVDDGEVDQAQPALASLAASSLRVDKCILHSSAAARLAGEDGVVLRARFTCPDGPLRVSFPILASLPASHRTLLENGDRDAPTLLAPGIEVEIATPSSPLDRLGAFVRLGFFHILEGWDHLAFLLGLLLLGGRARKLLGVVTAFTVGHSVSLALTTLGGVEPSQRAIEATVAASIAFVGVANLRRLRASLPSADSRAPLALGFGLVHGFAFASALRELALARAAALVPLVGFNTGVELGQLAVLALAIPVGATVARTRLRAPAAALASVTLVVVGAIVAVVRLVG